MKQYVGRFPINQGLTKKVNKNGWVIYRDPEVGLYAYNEEKDEEVSLLLWNASAKDVSDKTLECIRSDIERKEAEIAEYEGWLSTRPGNMAEEALKMSAVTLYIKRYTEV